MPITRAKRKTAIRGHATTAVHAGPGPSGADRPHHDTKVTAAGRAATAHGAIVPAGHVRAEIARGRGVPTNATARTKVPGKMHARLAKRRGLRRPH